MNEAPFRVIEGNFTIMDKQKALEAALSQIERNFGKGSIMRLGKNDKPVEVEAISTGSLGLDIALGIGGLPRGRVVEIFGPEFIRQDDACAACDRRGAEEGRRLRLCGCRACARSDLCEEARDNLEELIISQPDAGEQALEITDTLVRSGAIDVIVVELGRRADPQSRN